MSATLLPDPLWELIQPLLPSTPIRSMGGRPRLSDRACLAGILSFFAAEYLGKCSLKNWAAVRA
jgi:transposase